jgi:hypothetical protein
MKSENPVQKQQALPVYYVERLTLSCLWRIYRKAGIARAAIYVFDVTFPARLVAGLLSFFRFVSIEVLQFDLVDVRDQKGLSVYLRILYQDLAVFRGYILDEYKEMSSSLKDHGRRAAYLAKAPVCSYDFYGNTKYTEAWHVLTMLNVMRWNELKQGRIRRTVLVAHRRKFARALGSYAASFNSDVQWERPFILRAVSLGALAAKLSKFRLKFIKGMVQDCWSRCQKKAVPVTSDPQISQPIRMMAEYYGQLNLDRSECVSDLFFVHPQGVVGRDVCLVFNGSWDPVDGRKLQELRRNGVNAVALTPQSSLVEEAEVPVFRYSPSGSIVKFAPEWQEYAAEYERLRDYWKVFFTRYNIRVWQSWTKYDASHMAIADALSTLGGVSVVYQRAYETGSSPATAVAADIIFGFAPAGHEVECGNGSDFHYHVAVGYTGDGRFKSLPPVAQGVRSALMRHGARHIIAYFDENTVDDGRWFIGHDEARKNYTFWLEKLLANTELGLVFKPKRPVNLRQRLGNIAELLKRAEATGRCYVFEGGLIQGAFPPAAAALAADIAIHETLSAGTAGLESALAGTRTLLMDHEGWPRSPLYRLGPEVVFTDSERAWQVCREYFRDPKVCPRLGDWSAMIDELDPFHDGRAAERMSIYLKDLLEGLRRGETASAVMELAAERYARQWGKDKIQRGPRK